MLKSFLLSGILFFTLSLTSTYAKILRVGYPGTAVTGIDFATFKAAHDAATSGDTLHVYNQYGSISGGATSNVGHVNVTKKLIIIGSGFSLNYHTFLQAVINGKVGELGGIILNFGPGSQGSIAQGLSLWGLSIYANNITITRSIIRNYLVLANIEYPLSDIKITGCYVYTALREDGTYNTKRVDNLYIANNVFNSEVFLPNSYGIFANNILKGYVNINQFSVKNNIFINSSTVPNSNIFDNNLFSGGININIIGTGNKFGVSMPTVFANWNLDDAINSDTATESKLALAPGSPAIGVGKKKDGSVTDAGVFGGEAGDIYRLRGIPAVPTVYKLTAPSKATSTNPYTISVGVRSNN